MITAGHNEDPPPSDDEVLLQRYVKRLLERADDPEIKASMLDVIGRYLSAVGMIGKAPNKGTALTPEELKSLPFKATDDEPPSLGLPTGTELPF